MKSDQRMLSKLEHTAACALVNRFFDLVERELTSDELHNMLHDPHPTRGLDRFLADPQAGPVLIELRRRWGL